MKKIVKITISALLLSMTVWSVTACQQSIQSEGDNTGTAVSETTLPIPKAPAQSRRRMNQKTLAITQISIKNYAPLKLKRAAKLTR